MKDPRVALQPYLLSGETLRWTGRPGGGLLLTAADALLIPFSLLWGGFAIFWETTVLTSRAGGFFSLFGIPFVCVGLYLIVGRFFVDAWARSRTLYGLTDRRALILKSVPGGGITTVDLRAAGGIRFRPGKDGNGTIDLGGPAGGIGSLTHGGSSWSPALSSRPQFIAIADAAEVYRRIEDGKATR